ncbi:P-loop containing nucleoside triphosphate hydrolase protein, partial [Lentinula boryana]
MTHCPTSAKTFTGREEVLTRLEEFFLSGHAAEGMKTFLLYGLGGAGKTQIALQFIKRFKQRFTARFFITADQEDSIQGSYFDIAKTSGVQDAQSWQAGLHWLHSHEEDWLIVIDNADDPKIPLSRYLPSCDHGNVIITSRNPELMKIADQYVELSDMLPEEGIQLLMKHAIKDVDKISDADQNQAAKIAEKLYYFPLALVHAGAYINRQKCLSGYLDRLGDQREQLLSKGPQQPKDKYHYSVYETWNLSWGQLSEDSRMFLGLCAHLHYEHIPRSLFERGVKNLNMVESPLGPSKAVTEGKLVLQRIATSEMNLDDMKLDDIMDDAASYSLINKESSGYMFHPLVHQWLRDTIKDNHRQAVEGIIVLAVENISWKRDDLSQEDFKFFQRLSPHVTALGDFINCDYVVKLEIGHIWSELYKFQEAIIIWEPMLDIMIDRLGPEHKLTLSHEGKMAWAYGELGRANKALELQQKLVETLGRVMGVEHPDTLNEAQNLAITLKSLGRTDEPLELEQSLLETSKRVLGEEHPDTLSRTQSLAITLRELCRTNEALELLQSLLKTSKRVLGEEHPHTLTQTQSLAITLRELGRTNEALELEQSLLETSKRVLGEEHPHTLNRIQNLARTLRELGRTNEALELEQSLLETSKRVFGE